MGWRGGCDSRGLSCLGKKPVKRSGCKVRGDGETVRPGRAGAHAGGLLATAEEDAAEV